MVRILKHNIGQAGLLLVSLVAILLVACSADPAAPQIIEVEKQVVVEKEVIRTVEVPVETIVTVEKEVIKTVEVPVEKIVTVEKEVVVVKEVPVERVVIVEVERAEGEKVLNIATSQTLKTIMPHNARSGLMNQAYNLAFSRLLMADPTTGTWVPDLAERWGANDDLTAWTFNIRQNAFWGDGVRVTAKDVAFTLTSYLTPDTASRFLSNLENIKGGLDYINGDAATVVGLVLEDEFTIRIDLEVPDAFFLLKLTGIAGFAPIPILPEHLLASIPPKELITSDYFSVKPITSGAYAIVKYEPGVVLELKANDNYYFGKPKIDRIFMRTIKSPDAIQIGFQRGDLQLAFNASVTNEMYENAVHDPRLTIVGVVGKILSGSSFNMRRDYINDGRIHQAFLHALDRQALIDAFHNGNGRIVNVGLLHPWYHKTEWDNLFEYNPDKARELLAAAGWDSNREVDVLISPPRSEQARAELAVIQQMAAEVGFKMVYRELETAAFNVELQETYNWDMTMGAGGMSADPDGWITNRHAQLGTNIYGYGSDELDALITAGRRSIDLKERAAIYQEIVEDNLLVDLPIAGRWVTNTWWIKSNCFDTPVWDNVRVPVSLSDVEVLPVFIGRDDVWAYHIERWDITC